MRCTASLYDLYWHTTEKSVEEEGRSNMAADSADNDVINGDKERWDEYDDDYDSSGNVIIGGTLSITVYQNS